MPKPFRPQVATANHLREGHVIYFTRPGWTRRIEEAEVAITPEDADVLLSEASCEPLLTVGVTLIEVDLSTGSPQPLHFRETFRRQGPSIRTPGRYPDHV